MGQIVYPGAGKLTLASNPSPSTLNFSIPQSYGNHMFPMTTEPIEFNRNYKTRSSRRRYIRSRKRYNSDRSDRRYYYDSKGNRHYYYYDDDDDYDYDYDTNSERRMNRSRAEVRYKDSGEGTIHRSAIGMYDYSPYDSDSDFRPGNTKGTTTIGSRSSWNYGQTYAEGNGSGINGRALASDLLMSLGYRSDEKTLAIRSEYYNRFKLPMPHSAFSKAFPHVYFVRPDLNLMKEDGSGLLEDVAGETEYYVTYRDSPEIIKQLIMSNGSSHDWAFLLCNHATSFSLNDEYINTNVYGKTFTGYGISYGRHSIESKGAGSFTVDFKDDRNLSIYKTHKLWMDYISNCYRGHFVPTPSNQKNKILDYGGAVYYILCGPDDETIIFWSKYYGVFPSTVPSGHLAWAAGNMIEDPTISITYQYSFKEDFNPMSLLEMNMNTRLTSTTRYAPIYDTRFSGVGEKWVGAPYIELDTTDGYKFKLRHKSVGIDGEYQPSSIQRSTSKQTYTYDPYDGRTNESRRRTSNSTYNRNGRYEYEDDYYDDYYEEYNPNRTSPTYYRTVTNNQQYTIASGVQRIDSTGANVYTGPVNTTTPSWLPTNTNSTAYQSSAGSSMIYRPIIIQKS